MIWNKDDYNPIEDLRKLKADINQSRKTYLVDLEERLEVE